MNTKLIVNKLTKPTSNLNFDQINSHIKNNLVSDLENHSESIEPTEMETTENISLVDFSRMYKIGGIPIIDFVVVYIFLYVLNHFYFKFDFKTVLVGTIPITIILEFISNPKVKLSTTMLTILVLSIGYLIVNAMENFKK